MSRPWKSSDGGKITALGASTLSASYAVTTVLVAAGANVRGITIRTALIVSNGASLGYLMAGGVRLIGSRLSNNMMVLPYEVFVPAGREITLVRDGGTMEIDMTYDIH